MDIGRNDPCPCGSGKKYKKCCLAKDEEEAAKAGPPAAAAASPAAGPRFSPAPPDPLMEARTARWEEFGKGDYEEQIALFNQTLDEPELMDGEMVFEMLEPLFRQAIAHDERDRFDALVEKLRERVPEAYAEERHWCLQWLITNALATGGSERVPALALEMAPLAGRDFDLFHRVEEQLAYHGQLSALVEAVRIAWPEVRESDDILPWGVDEFINRATMYEMLDYLNGAAEPKADDPALIERLKFYGEFEPGRAGESLAYLTGQAARQWTMDDFDFSRSQSQTRAGRKRKADAEDEAAPTDAEQNLFNLSLEFIGWAHRVEGVPYTRAALGAHELFRFIRRREAGEIEAEDDLLEPQKRSRAHKVLRGQKFATYEHALCPDRERLDKFLGGMLGFMNFLFYPPAALFGLIPAWLRFLETRGLIDSERRARTLDSLGRINDDLLAAFRRYKDDPAPRQALERWREEARKAPAMKSRP